MSNRHAYKTITQIWMSNLRFISNLLQQVETMALPRQAACAANRGEGTCTGSTLLRARHLLHGLGAQRRTAKALPSRRINASPALHEMNLFAAIRNGLEAEL
jgi:hypothetical protein